MKKKSNPPAPKTRPPAPPGPPPLTEGRVRHGLKRQTLKAPIGPPPPGLGIPVWRKNPPTEAGLYWYSLRTTDKPGEGALRFCRVYWTLMSRDFDADPERTLAAVGGEGYPCRVEQFQRWWAGPLLEPE